LNKYELEKDKLEKKNNLVVDGNNFFFVINQTGLRASTQNKRNAIGSIAVKWDCAYELLQELKKIIEMYGGL